MISVPSKTFLAGEYLALEGGMALLAMTSPRFELHARPGTGRHEGIPAGSPAWKFVSRESAFFAKWDLSFTDPHGGAGGWGASTAQYLAACALRAGADWRPDARELLAQYRADAWGGQGPRPSGADLIGQWRGGLTFFEERSGTLATEAWPFADLRAFAVRTGVKLATHEHLQTLKVLDTESMAHAMADVRRGWVSADAGVFCEGLNDYRRALQAQGLVAESTLNLLHDLLWMNGVKAAKGCGAMGADVILAVTDTRVGERELRAWVGERGLPVTELTANLSGGLQ